MFAASSTPTRFVGETQPRPFFILSFDLFPNPKPTAIAYASDLTVLRRAPTLPLASPPPIPSPYHPIWGPKSSIQVSRRLDPPQPLRYVRIRALMMRRGCSRMVAATCTEKGSRRRKVDDGSARGLASGRGWTILPKSRRGCSSTMIPRRGSWALLLEWHYRTHICMRLKQIQRSTCRCSRCHWIPNEQSYLKNIPLLTYVK